MISLIPAGSLSSISLSKALEFSASLSSVFAFFSSLILLDNNETETGFPPKFDPEPVILSSFHVARKKKNALVSHSNLRKKQLRVTLYFVQQFV